MVPAARQRGVGSVYVSGELTVSDLVAAEIHTGTAQTVNPFLAATYLHGDSQTRSSPLRDLTCATHLLHFKLTLLL